MAKQELEYSIFKAAVWLGFILSCLMLFLDYFILNDKQAGIIEIVMVFISTFILWRLREDRSIESLKILFFSTVFILLNFAWFLVGGFTTSNSLIYFSALVISVMLFGKQLRPWVLTGVGINLIILILLEIVDPGFRAYTIKMSPKQLMGTDIYILISFITVGFMIAVLKINYDQTRDQIEEKSTVLQEQSEALEKMNLKLSGLNKDLEEIAKRRANLIRVQNQKLLDYAFMHSGKLNGMVQEIKQCKVQLEENSGQSEETLKKIYQLTSVLDEELLEISQKLQYEQVG